MFLERTEDIRANSNICSWTIRNTPGTPYGEIDIMEGFSDITQAYTTLHTQNVDGNCTFTPPANTEIGTSNQDSYDCGGDIGCSVIGQEGSYGTPMNENGGGVYAMEWTSDFINIYFFPRNAIPADITSRNPEPSSWGTPTANFESQYGDCDIDVHFPAQTIVSASLLIPFLHCSRLVLRLTKTTVLRYRFLWSRSWRLGMDTMDRLLGEDGRCDMRGIRSCEPGGIQ